MKRRLTIAATTICLLVGLASCGSDQNQPSTTTPVVGASVNGQQSPNAAGNNAGNDQNPKPSDAAPASTDGAGKGSTFDTQEKIGDNSP
jgi:hypothetical protein